MSRWTDADIPSLRERLAYDPDTGLFTWLPVAGAAGWNTKFAGKVAFARCRTKGYIRGAVKGRVIYAHRLAFAFMVGRWPNGEVDHINRDTADNRWCNLRECTRAQNACNMVGWAKSGFRGVYPIGNRWYARIKRNGRGIHLGSYATPRQAALAYDAAATKFDGEFVRLNLPAEERGA